MKVDQKQNDMNPENVTNEMIPPMPPSACNGET